MASTEIAPIISRPMPFVMRGAGLVFRLLPRQPWRLDPALLIQAASRDAGLPPNFPTHIETALEMLCRTLADEAKLHWLGRANQWDFIVTGLAEWLRLEEHFRRNPKLETQPLLPPLIVTGLPRSGTTFLHRLLCEVPDARPIPFYEHIRPIRRSSRFDFRRFEIEAKFFPWKLVADQYNMDAIHYVRPNEPDECNFALRIGMRSIVFWETAYIPSYLHWLLSQDMTVAYRDYRRVLLFHILTD